MARLPLHGFLPVGNGLSSVLDCSAAVLGGHFSVVFTSTSRTAAALTRLGSSSPDLVCTPTPWNGRSDHDTHVENPVKHTVLQGQGQALWCASEDMWAAFQPYLLTYRPPSYSELLWVP